MMGKRREGTGFDQREAVEDNDGMEELDEQAIEEEASKGIEIDEKERDQRQVQELLELLGTMYDEQGYEEADEELDIISSSDPADEDAADLRLTRRERQSYGIDHIDFEANTKAYAIQETEVPEFSVEDLPKIPDAPIPEIRSQLEPDLVTDKPPSEHTREHIGMYYNMGESADKLPKFVLKQMQPEFEIAAGKMLMIREPGLEVADMVRAGKGQCVIIDGKIGNGKSATALYAAHCAVDADQLVLSIGLDEIGLWDDRLGKIDTKPVKGLSYPTTFNMPDMAQRWFHWVRDTYETEMKAISVKGDHGVEDYYTIHPWADELDQELNPTKKISTDRVVPEGERAAKPTLYDFLNYASQDRKIAASLTKGFFEEIRAVDEKKVFKMNF